MILYNAVKHGRGDRQPLAAGDPRRRAEHRAARLHREPHQRDGLVVAGDGDADPGRRDGGVLVARAGRRLHQARHHGPGDPDPGRHDAPAGPDDSDERAEREPVPGDRRHVDVEPACRGRLGARQGRSPGLDSGGDQVGAHDLVPPGRRQGGRRHAGRSVRCRCRRAARQPGRQPDARLRRVVRRLRRFVGRSAPPDRPEPAQHRRPGHDRHDHDQADRAQRVRQEPGARRLGPGSGGREDHGLGPETGAEPARPGHEQTPRQHEQAPQLLGDDQRPGPSGRPVLRTDHPRPQESPGSTR